MKRHRISRRNFIGKSAATVGMATIGSTVMAGSSVARSVNSKIFPREVWIASVSQTNTIENILSILDGAKIYKPDIVCLPELFHLSNIGKKSTYKEKVELSDEALSKISVFSKENNCYTICPVYTHEKGKIYNAAVIFNRLGTKIGEYRKIHLSEAEISDGVIPGPLTPPVFKTDFGIIGIQICFDILWDESWKKLREQGAEIVFWPSAFAGGQMVNTKAWQNKYAVVSSTRKNTSKICDITGEVISQTGHWNKNLICAPVNLEKVFLHTWPYVRRFPEIQAKYGRKIKITHFHEEEWAIIESLSPDVSVNDIITEFELRTHEQHTRYAETLQMEARMK